METAFEQPMTHICLGILAHVDAGKTTLSEAMLYTSGSIRRLGRVDRGDAFLDTYELERERGITIFSKQAVFSSGNLDITLLDTPGHVDFSAETERTLQVLDYAILVVNGADGVQGHTRTLWRLLARYEVPVFLFVNKMDQSGADRDRLLLELKENLDEACIDFGSGENEEFYENIALCDERLLEDYLAKGRISWDEIRRLVKERRVFPCYFGSALRLWGVEELLLGLETWTQPPVYPEQFGARVYKIARDGQGNRLTYMKVTGGSLRVRDLLKSPEDSPEGAWEEKVDQIRIYSGAKFETAGEVPAGTVCAVTGLSRTRIGQGLGAEGVSKLPVLEPVLTYQIQLPPDCDAHSALVKLRQLEEEDPQLHIVWDERLGEIRAKLMGEVQTEVLKRLIGERFGISVAFGAGSIVYKETIAAPVEGVGHFEPLRHYAEVHLLLEPLEAGSGLVFDTACSEDMLDRNWQRLILTHLEEKEHRGVLIGAPVTDMKITLVAGRAHLKHTEGGDFRQATYRAVRQGLKKAKSVLLEPYYAFRLEIPAASVGRAMSDIQRMAGSFETPQTEGDMAVLEGTAPVSEMRDYQREVVSYTRGEGRLSCTFKGYRPCHNGAEVIEAAGYDSERDLDNPTGSVFCAHGAGYVVSWDQVEDYMHLDGLHTENLRAWDEEEDWSGDYGDFDPEEGYRLPAHEERDAGAAVRSSKEYWKSERELEEIFTRTYGGAKEKSAPARRTVKAHPEQDAGTSPPRRKKREILGEYLLVDGYNIIFAWDELKKLAAVNIDSARDRLKDILCNYQGFCKCTLILVFDAYRVEGHREEISKYHNIYVVFTKEAETADQYIEKTVHAIGKKYQVTVATSDGIEQVIILGQGARRLSALGLKEEIEIADRQMREEYGEPSLKDRNLMGAYMPEMPQR